LGSCLEDRYGAVWVSRERCAAVVKWAKGDGNGGWGTEPYQRFLAYSAMARISTMVLDCDMAHIG